MTRLRIKDAPLIETSVIQEDLKIPTGGYGDVVMNLSLLSDWVMKYKNIATKEYVSEKVEEMIEPLPDKTYVDRSVSQISQGAVKSYRTLSDAKAGVENGHVPVDSAVYITNDGENSGIWNYNGSDLLKSYYDPLSISKEYTDSEIELLKDTLGKYLKSATFKYDWNSINISGKYKSNPTGQSSIGSPENLAHLLLDHTEGTNGRAYQVCVSTAAQRLWRRSRDSNLVWSEWIEDISLKINSGILDTPNGNLYTDGDLLKRRFTSPLWNQTSKNMYKNSEEYNNLFNDLKLKFPDYITSAEIGEDDYGNKIYEYSFTPSQFRYVSPATPSENKNPEIVIVGGMHGTENSATTTLYLFFNELCNNWMNNRQLSDIRWGCTIHVVPCINPFGLNASQRRNGNNVDFNVNFPIEWEKSQSEFKGKYPLDQPETRLGRDLAVRHKNAKTMIDFHSHDNDYYTWVGTRSDNAFSIQKTFLREHQSWLRRNLLTSYGEKSLVASTGTAISGMVSDWTLNFGKNGFLLEMQQNIRDLPRNELRLSGFHALLSLIHANWLEESTNTGWSTEHFSENQSPFKILPERDGVRSNRYSTNTKISEVVEFIDVVNADNDHYYKVGYIGISEYSDKSSVIRIQIESFPKQTSAQGERILLVDSLIRVPTNIGSYSFNIQSDQNLKRSVRFNLTVNTDSLLSLNDNEYSSWKKDSIDYCKVINESNYKYSLCFNKTIDPTFNNFGVNPVESSDKYLIDPIVEVAASLGGRVKILSDAPTTNMVITETNLTIHSQESSKGTICPSITYPNVIRLNISEISSSTLNSPVNIKCFTSNICSPYGTSELTYRGAIPSVCSIKGDFEFLIKVADSSSVEEYVLSLYSRNSPDFDALSRRVLAKSNPLSQEGAKTLDYSVMHESIKHYGQDVVKKITSGHWKLIRMSFSKKTTLYPERYYMPSLYINHISGTARTDSNIANTDLIVLSGNISIQTDESATVNKNYPHLLNYKD